MECIKEKFAIELFKHSNKIIHYLRLYTFSYSENDIDYQLFDQIITNLKNEYSFLANCKINLNHTKTDLLHTFYYRKVLLPSIAKRVVCYVEVSNFKEPVNENYQLLENIVDFTNWLFEEIKNLD